MALGTMATVNQLVDLDCATLIAHEYEYEVESVAVEEETLWRRARQGSAPPSLPIARRL